MTADSALYVGRVGHTRRHPRRHHLAYACYWLLLDLDRLDDVASSVRLLSLNRTNLFAIHNTDYGDGSSRSLRAQATAHLAEAGIDIDGGRILLLSMPRILGCGFNPLSVYFCYRADGALAAMIYEVHNTFRQRHSYVVPVANGAPPRTILQTCKKSFYVSPFLKLDLTYQFEVREPQSQVAVGIRVYDQERLILTATLSGERLPLNDTSLMRVFVTHPFLTFKVITAIHWEALRLWWKGVRLVPRPAPPEHHITISSNFEEPERTQ
jgi:uncharacterized protein